MPPCLLAAAAAGSAAALRALAPFLSADQLPAALDFLLSCGLTDTNTTIREAMIAAGEGDCVAGGRAFLPYELHLPAELARQPAC